MTLDVYGVEVRRVRTLLNAPLSAGTFTETWDGRDDRGQRVASGAWFVRMRAAEVVDVRKITLIK